MIIGLDIGGTKINGILFDGKNVIKELTIVTPKNLFEFQHNLKKLVAFLSAGQKITAIGAGVAGLVDAKHGTVKYSPNIKYIKQLSLAKVFGGQGKIKVKIDNDSNCFTRAELLIGEGKKYNNFLCLTLGTGIGGGIVINRKIYRGEDNSGGELGHILLDGEFFESSFKKFRDKKDYKNAGRLVGRALASLINIFAPDAVIIGGGFGHNESRKYLPAAKTEIKNYIFNPQLKTKILISQLKNAGALGAALLVK